MLGYLCLSITGFKLEIALPEPRLVLPAPAFAFSMHSFSYHLTKTQPGPTNSSNTVSQIPLS